MIDKKEPVEPSNLEAAPVVEEDRTGPDNALKYPPGQDSDAHDDAGLHDKLQSPMKQDSDAQVHDKLQSPVEQDSDARDDVGLQDKLQSPAEQDPNWMEGLTPEVRMRVQRLQDIQSQYNELEKKLYKEIQALKDKYYEDSFKSLYNERSKIVNGEVDVESNTYETAEEATSDKKATKVKGIPYFWLTAMKNNELLAPLITVRDEAALKYLKDIKCCTIGDPLELKLDFFFDTNPFFTNSILTRTYKEIKKCEAIRDAPSTGTKINWFPQESLTREIPKYKQIEGHPKRKTRTEKCASFFDFFGDGENGIGCLLQDEIIPNAVSWYTRESLQEDSDEPEEDEFDKNVKYEYKDKYGLSWVVWRESSQEDSDETECFEPEDSDESSQEASKKRTRVEGLTVRKSRRIR